MLNWESIVQDYIIKYSNQIRKATEPLRTHFGISYFTYHKIDLSGNYQVLVDRPDWAEHYVDQKIYGSDPYLRHPSVYLSGLCFMESFGSDEYQTTIVREGKQVLDMDFGVTLIQKKGTEVEFFGFTGNQKTSSLENLYLNHPQILRSFGAYFKKELGPVLNRMEEEPGSLITLKGEDFFSKDLIHPENSLEKREDFYKDLGFSREIEQVSSLSTRERQCLQLLVEGKSAKETAKIAGLSPRTVEFYFENIKRKLGCWDKHTLFQFAKKMQEIGFL